MRSSHRESAELVGGESLLSAGVLACLAPMLGRELEQSRCRPVGQQAKEVAQVSPGLELVLLAAGDQRDEGGVPLGAVVAAYEEPVLAADGLAAQLALGAVVVEAQPSVLEKPRERDALVAGIAHG